MVGLHLQTMDAVVTAAATAPGWRWQDGRGSGACHRAYSCCSATHMPLCRRYSGFRYGSPEGRVLQCLLYKRSSPDDNHYAHPRAEAGWVACMEGVTCMCGCSHARLQVLPGSPSGLLTLAMAGLHKKLWQLITLLPKCAAVDCIIMYDFHTDK